MPLSINDSGTWRTVLQPYVNDSGVWRPVIVYVNDSGTWRIVSTRITLSNVNVTRATAFPTDATATYTLLSNGTVDRSPVGFVENWITPTSAAGAAYEALLHQVSGSTITGSALDTWLPLSSNRAWSLTQAGAGELVAVATVSIRRASDAVVLATANLNYSATSE